MPQTTFSTSCPSGLNAPGVFGISGHFDGNTLTGIARSESVFTSLRYNPFD